MPRRQRDAALHRSDGGLIKNEQPTNVAASVRARLLNLSRESGEEFGLLLSRFAAERFLYRLSISPHRESFLLKGAALFAVWQNVPRRPTRDVDFLGVDFSGEGDASPEHLIAVFRALCEIEAPEDGVRFDSASMVVSAIREEQHYGGQRVRFSAFLGEARVPLRMDVGFGDVVTPSPQEADYPTLLSLPAPRLFLYPPETVIAEKWQAMVELGSSNSRLKDFYDIWILSRHLEFDGALLSQAIAATFARRRTSLPITRPEALDDAFGLDRAKAMQWQAFGRKSRLQNLPLLHEVIRSIYVFLWPVTEAARNGEPFPMLWTAEKGWQPKSL